MNLSSKWAGFASLVFVLAATLPAFAGEVPWSTPDYPSSNFSRPSLSASVLKSDACWHSCEAMCGGGFQACIKTGLVNQCQSTTDRCNLFCQDRCRTYGGPLLNITNSGP